MADKQAKVAKNIAGKYYVDSTCIGCLQCVDIANQNFVEDSENGCAYVTNQPQNAAETERCEEALSSCPVNAIGNDGE